MTRVRRLVERDEPELRERLETTPTINLFLLACLEHNSMRLAQWFGVLAGPVIEAAVLVIPKRVVVPWSVRKTPAQTLGQHLREQGIPASLLVGPREASDALWQGWLPDHTPRRWHQQRLYVGQHVSPLPSPSGFRRAGLDDWPQIARYAADMTLEDMETDPYVTDPETHEQDVRRRIEEGRVFVIVEDRKIVFQMHIGFQGSQGCQIAGTYVPPGRRGEGLATLGVAEVTRRALRHHPVVTLHVNEANASAVHVYEKVGFQAFAPFRLAVP